MHSSSLNKKVAIVTGASSGLGKAVCEQLADHGVHVFALARTIHETQLPSEITKVPLNIRDLQSIDDAFHSIDQATSQIDILVNCAGRGLVKQLETTTRQEIMDLFGVNLKGNIYIAQEVYKRMIPRRQGHIINVSSTSGLKARADEPIYCATKWGLRGFTESLRLAAAAHQIRVSGVYPGGMQTNFWKGGEPRDTSKFMNPQQVAAEIIHLLHTPTTLAPSEYVIERGV
ncbi:SDR family oxidoreductase [Patescibacteria group bacterium]|nr:SDR family oxidoreductase [Patescibacteria group bacterium]